MIKGTLSVEERSNGLHATYGFSETVHRKGGHTYISSYSDLRVFANMESVVAELPSMREEAQALLDKELLEIKTANK